MTHDDNAPDGRPLPVKPFLIAIGMLFAVMVVKYFIYPSFISNDIPLSDKWTLDEFDAAQLGMTPIQLNGFHEFQEYCSNCHGPLAEGNGPQSKLLRSKTPDFWNPAKTLNGYDLPGVQKTLLAGAGEMPAFAHLPESTRLHLADYVSWLAITRPEELKKRVRPPAQP